MPKNKKMTDKSKKLIAIKNIGIICIFLMGLFSRAQNTNTKQPNILLIINDDQDAETLGVYGDNACDTPNIDKLASEGMSLTSAHHMGSFRAAVCTPSRCMLMTGRSVWETQNADPFR